MTLRLNADDNDFSVYLTNDSSFLFTILKWV